jgi:hypothetical protein
MVAHMVHISRVSDSIPMSLAFIRCVKREVLIIVFVLLSDSKYWKKNKKNWSSHLDMMATADIFLSKKLKKG